jgi:hypothetical protein
VPGHGLVKAPAPAATFHLWQNPLQSLLVDLQLGFLRRPVSRRELGKKVDAAIALMSFTCTSAFGRTRTGSGDVLDSSF